VHELGKHVISDLEHVVLNISTKTHGGWEPVGYLHGERVGVLTGREAHVGGVGHREHHVDNFMSAKMISVVMTLATLVSFIEVGIFFSVQANYKGTCLDRLFQVNVDKTLHDFSGVE
jgi:hypothetical protein